MFNKGFLCPECGPIPKSKQRSINKVKYDTCPECANVVKPWERPLNERAGRCDNCGHAAFQLAVRGKGLARECKLCGQVIDPDTKDVIQEGRRSDE